MIRRDFIRLVGTGATVGAATATLAGCGTPDVATSPWREAGAPHPDVRHTLLSWAVLAPNPHNLQPWLVDLRTPGELRLHVDRERLLPQTDPFGRQILIGHGCFLELLSMAATHHGLRARIDPFPAGAPAADALDDRPVARVVLEPARGVVPDPLFAHARARRSNKEPYDPARALSASEVDAIARASTPSLPWVADNGIAADWTVGQAAVEALRSLTWRAHEREATTPAAFMESVRLMRIGRDEIARHRDGITLSGPMIEVGRRLGLVDRAALADTTSKGFRAGMDRYRALAFSAMGFAWLTTSGNARDAQLAAGRAYLRMNLQATALGIGMHPWSQALQEYPEMDELRREATERLAPGTGRTVQMLVRLGYGPTVAPKPRRDPQALLRA